MLSLIAFEESDLERAIGYLDYAIKVLKTGINAAERSGKTGKNTTTVSDPFASAAKPAVEKTEQRGIQFGAKVWPFKSVYSLFYAADVRHFLPRYRSRVYYLRSAAPLERESTGSVKLTMLPSQ